MQAMKIGDRRIRVGQRGMWESLSEDVLVYHILVLLSPADLVSLQKAGRGFEKLIRANRQRLQRRQDLACNVKFGSHSIWMRNAQESRYLVFNIEEVQEKREIIPEEEEEVRKGQAEREELFDIEHVEPSPGSVRRVFTVKTKLSGPEAVKEIWRLVMKKCSFSALAFAFCGEEYLKMLLPFARQVVHSNQEMNGIEQVSFLDCKASSAMIQHWVRALTPKVLSVKMGGDLEEAFFREPALQAVDKLEIDGPVMSSWKCEITDGAFQRLRAVKMLLVVHNIALTTDGIVAFLRKCYEEMDPEKAEETIVVKTNFRTKAREEDVWARVTSVLPKFEFNSRSTVTKNGRRMGLRLEYDAHADCDGCKIYFIVIIMGPFEH